MVRGLEQFFLATKAGVEAGLGGGVQARAVVVNHPHAKAQGGTPGNGLADAPHADNAQGAAMHLGTGKHVVAPARPKACAQIVFALADAACRRHQKGEAEVGGGFGQHIGRVGAQHAGGRHGGQIKVVVAHGHVGAELELATPR